MSWTRSRDFTCLGWMSSRSSRMLPLSLCLTIVVKAKLRQDSRKGSFHALSPTKHQETSITTASVIMTTNLRGIASHLCFFIRIKRRTIEYLVRNYALVTVPLLARVVGRTQRTLKQLMGWKFLTKMPFWQLHAHLVHAHSESRFKINNSIFASSHSRNVLLLLRFPGDWSPTFLIKVYITIFL